MKRKKRKRRGRRRRTSKKRRINKQEMQYKIFFISLLVYKRKFVVTSDKYKI